MVRRRVSLPGLVPHDHPGHGRTGEGTVSVSERVIAGEVFRHGIPFEVAKFPETVGVDPRLKDPDLGTQVHHVDPGAAMGPTGIGKDHKIGVPLAGYIPAGEGIYPEIGVLDVPYRLTIKPHLEHVERGDIGPLLPKPHAVRPYLHLLGQSPEPQKRSDENPADHVDTLRRLGPAAEETAHLLGVNQNSIPRAKSMYTATRYPRAMPQAS